MRGRKQVFSTGNDNWSTPKWLYDLLNAKYRFDTDAAADHFNHLCDKYWTEEDDALKQDWKGRRIWINPPYTLAPKFIKKAWEERDRAEVIVMLIPVRSSNKEWHDFIFRGAHSVTFINGRLHFGDSKAGAPFPSAIVVFTSTNEYDGEGWIQTLDARSKIKARCTNPRQSQNSKPTL